MGILSSWEALQALNWKKVRVGDLFEPENGDFDIQKRHLNNEGHFVVSAGVENYGVIGKTNIKAKILPKNTLTCDMFGNVFYRSCEYKMVTHARVMCLHFLRGVLTRELGLFFVGIMKHLKRIFSFGNMATWSKIKHLEVMLPHLPTGEIAFKAMEVFIREIQTERLREIQAYLKVTGLENTTLTKEEENALSLFTHNFDSCGGGGGGGGIILLLSA
ncbi:restriction endonuclease subunit S [Helicobacter suis]|uniref:restriction endonuclease subunit S n=1 Tax=Helicobacter suis TaxID=104628 RepID=UPI0013D7EBBC|nr:restriction endonuclease subunit S [Helicobacter suis]